MKKFCYLAGPIEGCTGSEINLWRETATTRLAELSDNQIVGINPYRAQETEYKGESSVAKQIYDKNYYDTVNCDVVLAYLPKHLNERRPSYGTTFEIAWATMLNKPIFIITNDPDIERHPLFKASTQFFFKDVDEACSAINDLIGGYI